MTALHECVNVAPSLWSPGIWNTNGSLINIHMPLISALVTTVLRSSFNNLLLPFFGRPLPFPSRDFLSSSLLLGLVGATEVPLTTSPLSLSESPLPESLEEFFLSLRLALAFRRASWMLLLEEATQLPLISLLIFLLEVMKPPLSSSPETKESLRSPTSVGLQEKIVVSSCLVWFDWQYACMQLISICT